MVAAAILVAERGFNPNTFKIKDQTQATSFSLYLQFAYDGALLNECSMHGSAALLIAPAPASGAKRQILDQAKIIPPPLLQM